MSAGAVCEAYRWQHGLGNQLIATAHGRIIINRAHPLVWDANHVDTVTAQAPDEIDALLLSMEEEFHHTKWRVVHTDPFTPEPFTARLAFDGYDERPAIIQMLLDGEVRTSSRADIRAVETETDWQALGALLDHDHAEGARTAGAITDKAVTQGILASYRAKESGLRFHLACVDGMPVGYGALAAAPSGAGMIEDLFTLPAHRRRGLASAMIAEFTAQLRAEGCTCIFLGAMAGEQARHLYAKLGFRPLLLTRSWLRKAT